MKAALEEKLFSMQQMSLFQQVTPPNPQYLTLEGHYNHVVPVVISLSQLFYLPLKSKKISSSIKF